VAPAAARQLQRLLEPAGILRAFSIRAVPQAVESLRRTRRLLDPERNQLCTELGNEWCRGNARSLGPLTPLATSPQHEFVIWHIEATSPAGWLQVALELTTSSN